MKTPHENVTALADSEIPTPGELFNDQSAALNVEADGTLAAIVTELRRDPTRNVVRSGNRIALEIVKRRLESRGWVCSIFNGDQRDPGPTISVCAPATVKY